MAESKNKEAAEKALGVAKRAMREGKTPKEAARLAEEKIKEELAK